MTTFGTKMGLIMKETCETNLPKEGGRPKAGEIRQKVIKNYNCYDDTNRTLRVASHVVMKTKNCKKK